MPYIENTSRRNRVAILQINLSMSNHAIYPNSEIVDALTEWFAHDCPSGEYTFPLDVCFLIKSGEVSLGITDGERKLENLEQALEHVPHVLNIVTEHRPEGEAISLQILFRAEDELAEFLLRCVHR